MSFKDHFSTGPDNYRRFRPEYPPELFVYLASLSNASGHVWDCATGSGQAAVKLAQHFATVIATDASSAQLQHAAQHPNIDYHLASAEQSGLSNKSISLVTVAQALHWFDLEAFSAEVNRVIEDNGLVAAWTYNLASVSTEVDAVVARLYNDLLGRFWPPERKFVENGYASIQLPFEELRSPEFTMQARWRYNDFVGYLNTWSAVRGYEQQHHASAIELVQDELLLAWGNANSERLISWPLTLKLWRSS